MNADETQADPALLALQALRRELTEHPYRTVAIAAGIGYVFGTRLGGPLVKLLSGPIGMRMASTALAPLRD